MKIKYLIICVIAFSLMACENQENEFDDFGSTSVYFPFQTPVRTLIQGSNILLVFLFLWIICVIISIFYCFKCFKPQMELKYDNNVFFFRDAVYAFGSSEEYSKKVIEVCGNEDELCKQLSEQLHVESKIIDQKFICVKKSITFFGLSFIFVILFILYWIISTVI